MSWNIDGSNQMFLYESCFCCILTAVIVMIIYGNPRKLTIYIGIFVLIPNVHPCRSFCRLLPWKLELPQGQCEALQIYKCIFCHEVLGLDQNMWSSYDTRWFEFESRRKTWFLLPKWLCTYELTRFSFYYRVKTLGFEKGWVWSREVAAHLKLVGRYVATIT